MIDQPMQDKYREAVRQNVELAAQHQGQPFARELAVTSRMLALALDDLPRSERLVLTLADQATMARYRLQAEISL